MSYSEKYFTVKNLMNKIEILHRLKTAKICWWFKWYSVMCFVNITVLVFVGIKHSFLKHTYKFSSLVCMLLKDFYICRGFVEEGFLRQALEWGRYNFSSIVEKGCLSQWAGWRKAQKMGKSGPLYISTNTVLSQMILPEFRGPIRAVVTWTRTCPLTKWGSYC